MFRDESLFVSGADIETATIIIVWLLMMISPRASSAVLYEYFGDDFLSKKKEKLIYLFLLLNPNLVSCKRK